MACRGRREGWKGTRSLSKATSTLCALGLDERPRGPRWNCSHHVQSSRLHQLGILLHSSFSSPMSDPVRGIYNHFFLSDTGRIVKGYTNIHQRRQDTAVSYTNYLAREHPKSTYAIISKSSSLANLSKPVRETTNA